MKSKKVVGKVTLEERDKIKYLFKRKNSLLDLISTIEGEDNQLTQEVEEELQKIKSKVKKWWSAKKEKYGWSNNNLYIEFDSCKIIEQEGVNCSSI